MSRPPFIRFRVEPEAPNQRIGAADIIRSVLVETQGGRLAPGSRLPPVRALEAQLGLSKNTAQAAYDELVARGVLEAREREGVFVASRSAESLSMALPDMAPPLPRLRPAPDFGVSPKKPGSADIELSTVFIDPELLPRERLADCARSVLKAPGLATHYDAQGHPPLRAAIAARLNARGFDISPDNVIITTGSQQGIDMVARASEVRRAVVETPVYPHARLAFESVGMAVSGLTLDPFTGVDLARWDEHLARARPGLFYTITSFQNPTGYSYTTTELIGILELARKYDVSLLEDDWGSDMLSGSDYRPMLRMLGGENVLYLNSFTKKLLPSLRLGYLVAPSALIPSLVAMKRVSTLGNAWLTEAVLCEFLERGYYDTHLAALQTELDIRYSACLEMLRDTMPDGVRWTRPGGGPTLWLDLPKHVHLPTLRVQLAERGVRIESTSASFVGEAHLNGFRVSYAYLPTASLRKGLSMVADLLRLHLGNQLAGP